MSIQNVPHSLNSIRHVGQQVLPGANKDSLHFTSEQITHLIKFLKSVQRDSEETGFVESDFLKRRFIVQANEGDRQIAREIMQFDKVGQLGKRILPAIEKGVGSVILCQEKIESLINYFLPRSKSSDRKKLKALLFRSNKKIPKKFPMANLLLIRGAYFNFVHLPELALENLRMSLDLIDEHKEIDLKRKVYLEMGKSYLSLETFQGCDQAMLCLKQAEGVSSSLVSLFQLLCEAQFLKGHYDEALSTAHDGIIAEQAASDSHKALRLAHLFRTKAKIFSELKRFEEADEAFQEAEKQMVDSNISSCDQKELRAFFETAKARHLLLRGRFVDAMELANSASENSREVYKTHFHPSYLQNLYTWSLARLYRSQSSSQIWAIKARLEDAIANEKEISSWTLVKKAFIHFALGKVIEKLASIDQESIVKSDAAAHFETARATIRLTGFDENHPWVRLFYS